MTRKVVVRSFVIVLSVLLAVGIGFLAYRHIVPTKAYAEGMIYLYESLSELEEKSDTIVEVSVAGKGRNVVEKSTVGAQDSYYTYTPVKVEKVHKGDVNPGDVIEIIEPVGYQRLLTGLYYHCRRGYEPIKQATTYLLFLQENPDGDYPVSSQRKFVWPTPQERTAESLEITELSSQYEMLLDAIAAKY